MKSTARNRDFSAANETPDPSFNDTLELDLSAVEPSVGGSRCVRRNRILVSELKPRFNEVLTAPLGPQGFALSAEQLGRQRKCASGMATALN